MDSRCKDTHAESIQKVATDVFGCNIDAIARMTVGLDNEVYSVAVAGTEYVFRLNERDSLKGSSKYIPLFTSKGIKVPDIIAEDYSKTVIPYNWQILSKTEGTDLGNVFFDLSHEQLDSIAKEISEIIKKLLTIPTDGRFGHIGVSDKKLKNSLIEVVQDKLATVRERNQKTGVLKKEYIDVFEKMLSDNAEYFRNTLSRFYFDDMNSKNVMVKDGQFMGLVDLDVMTYGDYLESIGSIKISWYGTPSGEYYTNAIMNDLELSEVDRKIVTMWALLNKIFWQSEIGVQFNKNSSTEIDEKRVEEGNIIINGLLQELNVNL